MLPGGERVGGAGALPAITVSRSGAQGGDRVLHERGGAGGRGAGRAGRGEPAASLHPERSVLAVAEARRGSLLAWPCVGGRLMVLASELAA